MPKTPRSHHWWVPIVVIPSVVPLLWWVYCVRKKTKTNWSMKLAEGFSNWVLYQWCVGDRGETAEGNSFAAALATRLGSGQLSAACHQRAFHKERRACANTKIENYELVNWHGAVFFFHLPKMVVVAIHSIRTIWAAAPLGPQRWRIASRWWRVPPGRWRVGEIASVVDVKTAGSNHAQRRRTVVIRQQAGRRWRNGRHQVQGWQHACVGRHEWGRRNKVRRREEWIKGHAGRRRRWTSQTQFHSRWWWRRNGWRKERRMFHHRQVVVVGNAETWKVDEIQSVMRVAGPQGTNACCRVLVTKKKPGALLDWSITWTEQSLFHSPFGYKIRESNLHPKSLFFFLFDPYGLVVIVPERADTQRQGENIKDGQDNNTVRLSVGQSN